MDSFCLSPAIIISSYRTSIITTMISLVRVSGMDYCYFQSCNAWRARVCSSFIIDFTNTIETQSNDDKVLSPLCHPP